MSIIDWLQGYQIKENESNNKKQKDEVELIQIDNSIHKNNNDYLILITHALWELLKEQNNLTEKDLFDKIEELDLKYGRLDGGKTPKVKDCENCLRPNKILRVSCVYCGANLKYKSAFDKI